jgi:hypothetical protein
MDRAAWMALADRAAMDPSLAQDAARRLAAEIAAAIDAGEWDAVPWGYLYAGAHKLVATVENLAVEPIAPPPAPQLTQTSNPTQVTWRIPFDCFAFAISAYARPQFAPAGGGAVDGWPFELGGALDGRDLFSVRWTLNGTDDYISTGYQSVMLPASLVTGTGLRPRPIAWQLGRRDTLGFQFRNLTNAFGSPFAVPLAEANVTIAVLRMEPA